MRFFNNVSKNCKTSCKRCILNDASPTPTLESIELHSFSSLSSLHAFITSLLSCLIVLVGLLSRICLILEKRFSMGITSWELPGMTFDFTFPLEKCFSHLAGVDFAAVVEKCQPILPQQLQSLPQGGDIPHRVHRLLVLEEGTDPLSRGGDSTPEEEVCGVLDAVIGVFGFEPVHITRSPRRLS